MSSIDCRCIGSNEQKFCRRRRNIPCMRATQTHAAAKSLKYELCLNLRRGLHEISYTSLLRRVFCRGERFVFVWLVLVRFNCQNPGNKFHAVSEQDGLELKKGGYLRLFILLVAGKSVKGTGFFIVEAIDASRR